MTIYVIGTRGIPGIQGGVETHTEELYPLIVQLSDHSITVLGRSSYAIKRDLKIFKGVSIKNLYAPRNHVFEAIVHSLIAVLYAAIKRPDAVHIHAVGPNLVAPLFRLLGLKVVMTHHGPDYERKKWGKIATFFLKLGEFAGVKFANKVIVISPEISRSIEKKFKRKDAAIIPNGVAKVKVEFDPEPLIKYNLSRYKYIFTLGRFVPEKGFDYLIKAYKNANLESEIKLVIAGDADHESVYSKQLKELAVREGIILTGFIKGNELAQIFSNCGLFILPSFYEGLPISLLEAMNYKLPILSSDIPANTQVELHSDNYFEVGNEQLLSRKIRDWADSGISSRVEYNMDKYDWSVIAKKTIKVYEDLL